MLITSSIEALCDCPREENYDYAPLFKCTYEARKIHEMEVDYKQSLFPLRDSRGLRTGERARNRLPG